MVLKSIPGFNCVKELFVIVLTFVLIIITPVVLLDVCFMISYRFITCQLRKVLKPQLGNLVSLSSAPLVADLVYNAIPKTPLLATVHLDGHLDIEHFRRRMLGVINQVDIPGRHIRPELQQYPTTWCGLLFWKWEAAFDISEHVRIWDEYALAPVLNEDDIVDIGNTLLSKPFQEEKSPWEFLVLHNTRAKHDLSNDPRTTVVFRIHHGLADGYSLLKLVMQDLSRTQVRLAQPIRTHNQTEAKRLSIFQYLWIGLKSAYELSTTVVYCYDINHWHLVEAKMSGKVNGAVSQPLPLDYIKSVKKKCGVTFAALLLSAFAGGLEEFFTKRGLKVPKSLHCFTVLPFLNHPLTLTNHLTGGFVLLPLTESSPLRRLATIHASLESLKRSSIPTTVFYLIRLAGVQFGWVTWKTFWNALPTAAMSNFPGPEDEAECLGLPILDGGFVSGFGPGNATVGFSCLSYNGKVRVAAGFDQNLIPAITNCRDLTDCIIQEITKLELLT